MSSRGGAKGGASGNRRFLRFLYETNLGGRLLGLFIRPGFSALAGHFLSSPLSRPMIRPFVKKHGIPLEEYPPERYRSFNAFFTRKILPENRPLDPAPRHLIAPCDGYLTAAPIGPDAVFSVKGVSYTLAQLLQDPALAGRYQGGTLLLFRLTPADYHRYCYVSDGTVSVRTRIPGVFHTVDPTGAARQPVYRENTREYCLLETAEFGTILIMEVGALLVGRIVNHPAAGPVRRGQEKGYFQFGGSTVILLLEPGRLQLEDALLARSAGGRETPVRMGECVGTVL